MKQSLIICLILFLIMPIDIEAKKNQFGKGLFWELSDSGTLTISGYGDMPDFNTNHKIPWYKFRKNITKVVIEEGVTSIGKMAFCKSLFSKENERFNICEVIFPKSLRRIEFAAFMDCTCLKHVRFNDGLSYIGNEAFYNCDIRELLIPNSVKEIGVRCFVDNINMKVLKLSENLETINEGTFMYCLSLEELSFPKNLKTIGKKAFCNAETGAEIKKGNVLKLTIPKGVESIGEDAFCGNIFKEISLSSSIRNIGENAFAETVSMLGPSEYKCYNGKILSLPSFVNENNSVEFGISSTSIKKYMAGIRNSDGYLILESKDGRKINKIRNKKYWIIEEGSKKGLINGQGKWIIPLGNLYSDIESIGDVYIKIKRNDFFGVITLDGKEIIPISRGYISITNFDSNKRTFAFSKKGYTGICNDHGIEISSTKLPTTADDIKENGGFTSVVAVNNGSTKYYIVKKNGHYGLTDSEGRELIPCEMDALESAGDGYLKFKLNSFWGLMNYQKKILIDTSRGYTYIGNYVSLTKRFPYEMDGYKGECNQLGQQVSKIRYTKPKTTSTTSSPSASSSNNSSSSNSSSSSTNSNSNSSNSDSGNKTTTVVVEHHHDPVPVQEWQQCTVCWGSGTCPDCAGSGTKYVGDSLKRCWRCGGRGKCSSCSGQGGRYYTVYR